MRRCVGALAGVVEHDVEPHFSPRSCAAADQRRELLRRRDLLARTGGARHPTPAACSPSSCRGVSKGCTGISSTTSTPRSTRWSSRSISPANVRAKPLTCSSYTIGRVAQRRAPRCGHRPGAPTGQRADTTDCGPSGVSATSQAVGVEQRHAVDPPGTSSDRPISAATPPTTSPPTEPGPQHRRDGGAARSSHDRQTTSTECAPGAYNDARKVPSDRGSTTHQHGSPSNLFAMAISPKRPVDVAEALSSYGYLPDEGLATAVFLALALRRPLLLEGEAGVGKTEVAKVLSRWTGGELIRLQCYEGIDVAQAVYDWDYARQLLHLRAAEATRRGARASAPTRSSTSSTTSGSCSSGRCCRPSTTATARRRCCSSTRSTAPTTSSRRSCSRCSRDYQITVPELGAFTAAQPPIVILTSNRTRDVHDALKRRCLYHWVEHPDFEREVAIVRLRVPAVLEPLARQVAAAVEALRELNLYKPPGVAETIDWAQRLGRARRHRARRGHGRWPRSAPCSSTARTRSAVRQHGIADLVKQAFERGRAPRRDRGTRHRRHAGRADGGRLRAACCAAPGCGCRSGSVLAFVEALGTRRARRPRPGVLGRPGDAGAPPRGHRRCTTGRSPCSGTAAASSPAPTPPTSRCTSRSPSTTTDDDGDDDDGERRRRPTTRRSAAVLARSRCCATRTSPPTPTTSCAPRSS